MKKMAILGTFMGILFFSTFTQGTSVEATTVKQSTKSEIVFPASHISEFKKEEIQQTNALKDYKGNIIILTSIKPSQKYELRIGEVDIKGTGVHNVQPVTLNKIGFDLSLINVSKILDESAFILFYVEKSNPHVAVDYFFVNDSLIK
ncbi:hypothetical protein ACWOC1_08395 [Enterococcus quebecensis]|uniref:NEAT domain-containing protein n=1 Tax=Enterococcus quebecensis TaxID=903983 RepID=A0A1E5GQ02_9ENTE|nr:hypothetical protein [Enterococcus quebecensis]OEG14776.1 hypothetical protein BCR23_11820 [Enterococcus quebecensis]OJG73879.1 hypothetical protein RV12_GL000460 [Enterococcus quebecensis]